MFFCADDLATTGFKVGVGLAVTVVVIAGIFVTLCYLKRYFKFCNVIVHYVVSNFKPH